MKTKRNMRILIFMLTTASVPGQVLSQNNDQAALGNSELKLNVGYALLGFVEMSYDRVLNDESTLGISTGFSFDDVISYDFMAIPNYKFFFGGKPAAGFFIEGNMALYNERYGINDQESDFGLGFGIAVGGKFLTKKGFVGELILGGGRNVINDSGNISDGYYRLGISIGKRF